MIYVFWISLGIILYVYFGYPLLLFVLSRLARKKSIHKTTDWPKITLLIAAHNEEKVIAAKIGDSLALDYPSEKLQIIVASDGSSDRTNEIVKRFLRQVVLVSSENQVGKSAIQNMAMAKADGEIIIFSDAPTRYNKKALKNLVRNFSGPKAGVVTGKVIYVNRGSSDTSRSEGLYWAYESFIRELESRLGILAMGSGCILAIRKTLFSGLKENVGEDFVLPLKAVAKGYKVLYEKEALAYEDVTESRNGLFRTKYRIISKDLKGLFMHRRLLNPLAHPVMSFSLVSHKLLRWQVLFFMLAVLAANLLLLDQLVFRVFFVLQLLFYGSALLGYSNRVRMLAMPFNFCLVNIASAVGTIKFITGRTSGTWSPQRR